MITKRRQSYFCQMALVTATQSYSKELKVGAVAIRDGRPICSGFNGTPPGEDNRCENIVFYDNEDGNSAVRYETKPDVEHAERNLIYFAAKEGIALKGAALFVTHSPCIQCARAILHAGISEVYFINRFKSLEGVDFLKSRIGVCEEVSLASNP
jgi:dCMP deaminase